MLMNEQIKQMRAKVKAEIVKRRRRIDVENDARSRELLLTGNAALSWVLKDVLKP